MRKLIVVITLIVLSVTAKSQEVYQHISNKGVYDLLDELASAGVIHVNASVKPYSRMFIAQSLNLAKEQFEQLTPRQQAEVDFYLKDFSKELNPNKNFKRRLDAFYYKDSLFSITINPIMGVMGNSNDSGLVYRRWVGAEAYGYIGKGWGFYASLRDFSENQLFTRPEYLVQEQGGNYKINGKGGEFSDMRGGVTYSWRWGSFGVVKDHLSWGSGYNGTNILSGRTPSFAMIKLRIAPVKWAELNYIHGWLVSEVVDTNRTYYAGRTTRKTYHPKYIAANFLTFTPTKRFKISVGNSIIYSDIEVQPAYLTPFFFYKSVDHHLNGMSNQTGQNSQMFFDLSVYPFNRVHLYSTLFLDELALADMFDKENHSNYLSIKAGMRLSNLPFRNVFITGEYTRTNPEVYKHIVNTTTFESNKYNLGHYLTDNSDEVYLSFAVKPYRGLLVNMSYTKCRKGPAYDDPNSTRRGLPFMESVVWESSTIALDVRYEVLNDGYLFLGVSQSDYTGDVKTFTPQFKAGKQLNITFGGAIGF